MSDEVKRQINDAANWIVRGVVVALISLGVYIFQGVRDTVDKTSEVIFKMSGVVERMEEKIENNQRDIKDLKDDVKDLERNKLDK